MGGDTVNNVNDLLKRFSYFKIEDFDTGGLRKPEDSQSIDMSFHNNGTYLFCHRISSHDEVVFEVHSEIDRDSNSLDAPICISTALNNQQRMDLALYLLSTVNIT